MDIRQKIFRDVAPCTISTEVNYEEARYELQDVAEGLPRECNFYFYIYPLHKHSTFYKHSWSLQEPLEYIGIKYLCFLLVCMQA